MGAVDVVYIMKKIKIRARDEKRMLLFTTYECPQLPSQVLVSKRVDRLIRKSKEGEVVITKIVPEGGVVRIFEPRLGDVKGCQRSEFVHASAEVLSVLTLYNPRNSVLVHDGVVVGQGILGFAALDDTSDQLRYGYRGGGAVHRRRERAHDIRALRGVLLQALSKGYIFRKTPAES